MGSGLELHTEVKLITVLDNGATDRSFVEWELVHIRLWKMESLVGFWLVFFFFADIDFKSWRSDDITWGIKAALDVWE